MATNTQIIESYDSLYEKICDDIQEGQEPITEEQFDQRMDELLTAGYIVHRRHEDDVFIEARPGLKWSDFHSIDEPIKKNILLYLVENPNVFFVLFNTQKGKLRIAVNEMKQWSTCQDRKVVTFMIVDNDKALADQSADGVVRILGYENVKLFVLSSNSKTSTDEIKTYIDAYAHDDDYNMPVIVLLPNSKQNDKMIAMLSHIRRKVMRNNSKLRYGIIVDEADKTYPMIRDKTFTVVGGERHSLLDFIVNEEALHRIGFVTATDGDLLEDYPECRNAYMYPIEIDEGTKEYYRAFHSSDAVVHLENSVGRTRSNNAYAEKIIEENLVDFTSPIIHNGVQIYRKIIINSNPKGNDMLSLARFALNKGMYAITFNQNVIFFYRPNASTENFKIKGMRLNELFFCIYKTLALHDKPIVIIGRRKVDRGLGFHYAPRKNPMTQTFDKQTIHWSGNANYPGNMFDVESVDGEGLIWTDMILGRIEDVSTASQKAGRLAGIIGQCPQYNGKLHFWTDALTSRRIIMHNQKVDITNNISGYSAIQSIHHARERVTNIPIATPVPDHVVHSELFATSDLAKKWCSENLVEVYGSSTFGLYKEDGSNGTLRNGTHIKKRGILHVISSREETECSDLGFGVKTSARIMPVRENGSIQYIVIYTRGKLVQKS
jgi:hypothetical protein